MAKDLIPLTGNNLPLLALFAPGPSTARRVRDFDNQWKFTKLLLSFTDRRTRVLSPN